MPVWSPRQLARRSSAQNSTCLPRSDIRRTKLRASCSSGAAPLRKPGIAVTVASGSAAPPRPLGVAEAQVAEPVAGLGVGAGGGGEGSADPYVGVGDPAGVGRRGAH